MISLQEIYQYLDDLLQINEFDDYCPNGLQVEGSHDVRKIGTAVSANLETIEAAVASRVDCLITHHGIFWHKDSERIVGTKKRKIDLLLKHNISLISYHLPLDAHRELGNNWGAALELGWTSCEPFGSFGSTSIGVKGKVGGVPRDEFKSQLERYYDHEAHVALGGPERIETAALVSGGAYRLLHEASQNKIDCFITGNYDEPAWSSAFEEKINFIALGHSATEKVGPKACAKRLKEQFQVDAEFIDIFNPF